MKFQLRYFLLTLSILFSTQFLRADNPIIAQVADGGGWQTTIAITNTSANSENASLIFFQDTTNGNTTGWNPPFLEVNSTQGLMIPAASTQFLHTQGTAPTVSQGWGQLQGGADIVAYAIFTQRVPGRTDQDGTAIASVAASRILLPFDNTSGAVVAIAIANPNSSAETVNVNLATSNGITQPAPLNVPAFGHTVFVFPTQFPSTNATNGLAELYSSSGTISVVPLRFNSSGGFTVAPAYSQTGPPIIGASSAPGNPYSYFELFSLTFLQGSLDLPFVLNNDNTTYQVYFNDSNPVFTDGTFSNNGMSFAASQLASNGIKPFGIFTNEFSMTTGTFGASYLVSSASFSFTLTTIVPDGNGNLSGHVSGTMTIVGTPYPAGGAAVTFTGPMTGVYQATLK